MIEAATTLMTMKNYEFPNSDERDALAALLALKEGANLRLKNQSSEKPGKAEEEVRDQLNGVRASVQEDKFELRGATYGNSVHSFFDQTNSKEDKCPLKAPAVEANWVVKQTRSEDAGIQNMLKLELDKFSSKLNQMSEEIKEIKRILLKGDLKIKLSDAHEPIF